jgi:hypothetical protein|tara:strand:+ start:7482 stop:7952 length:471 start_codon:yes stop_codon:yes gene_type:complete
MGKLPLPPSQDVAEARRRINKARQDARITHFDYITEREGIGVDRVLCKLCGALLKALVPLSDLGKEEVINGKTVVTQPVALRETNNFAEITIEFDDGSAHTTMTCKSCIGGLSDEELELLYAADMAHFDREERANKGKVRWHLMAHRIPTGFVRNR